MIKVEAGQYRALKALGIELPKNATKMDALAAVEKAAGGQALAFSKTTSGAFARVSAAVDQISDDIGAALLPAIGTVATAFVDDFLPAIKAGIADAMPKISAAFDWLSTNVLPALRAAFDVFVKDVLPAFGNAMAWLAANVLPKVVTAVQWFVKNVWPTIVQAFRIFVNDVMPPVVSALEKVADFLLNKVAPAVSNVVNTVLPPLVAIFNNVLVPALNAIVTAFSAVATAATTIFGPAIDIILAVLRPLLTALQTAADLMDRVFGKPVVGAYVNGLPGGGASSGTYYAPGTGTPGAPTGGIGAVGGIPLGGAGKLKFLADGGIVRKPTLAVVGESGPEAVVPLNKMGGTVINIYGQVIDGPALDRFTRQIVSRLRLAGVT
jgi:hypothetical protein